MGELRLRKLANHVTQREFGKAPQAVRGSIRLAAPCRCVPVNSDVERPLSAPETGDTKGCWRRRLPVAAVLVERQLRGQSGSWRMGSTARNRTTASGRRGWQFAADSSPPRTMQPSGAPRPKQSLAVGPRHAEPKQDHAGMGLAESGPNSALSMLSLGCSLRDEPIEYNVAGSCQRGPEHLPLADIQQGSVAHALAAQVHARASG